MRTSGPGLPFILSVPHGGRRCPPELLDRVVLSDRDLLADGGAFTDEIYDLTGTVVACQRASIARAFVDLNRAPGDLPPANTDGAVKSATCHGVTIYGPGLQPDTVLVQRLIDRYHRPYHLQLDTLAAGADVLAGLDCHSMEPIAPRSRPTPGGSDRPSACRTETTRPARAGSSMRSRSRWQVRSTFRSPTLGSTIPSPVAMSHVSMGPDLPRGCRSR